MANKKQPLLIEPKDFPVFLAARTSVLGGGIAALAELLGASPATAYQLLNGTILPSPEILKRAGLRMVYVLDVTEAEEPPAAPAKGKK